MLSIPKTYYQLKINGNPVFPLIESYSDVLTFIAQVRARGNRAEYMLSEVESGRFIPGMTIPPCQILWKYI